MNQAFDGRLRFGDCELDPQAGKLYRQGVRVKLQPQPLRVLTVLLENAGQIVSREELRERVWGGKTFVEFDQGLNYCIRQVRLALHDNASTPAYIETLPKQGYRLIAPMRNEPPPVAEPPAPSHDRKSLRYGALAAVLVLVAAASVYALIRPRAPVMRYTQITDFTDSATDPVLSPDGRMIAFIRGSRSFLTADQIWVMMLPGGEAKRLTDDPRLKYGIAFSPDGSEIAYTVLNPPNWSTYTVPVLGGQPQLLLDNAAGLTWLDAGHALFSTVREGVHMGVVRSTFSRSEMKEIYFPANERAMAHAAYPSPDRRTALVVQMDSTGAWSPCELVSLNGNFAPRPIGPAGPCLAAAWSPDGAWMYFTAQIASQTHLWRQRFSGGQPEQLTSGATGEEGIAVDHGGRSLITSVGVQENSIWLHDPRGERSLSSEGQVINGSGIFSADGKTLYYLLKRTAAGAGAQLWRLDVASGASAAVFPGVSMLSFDVSRDGRHVVYTVGPDDAHSEVWIAPLDRSRAALRIGRPGDTQPHFAAQGKIVFRFSEGRFNYLGAMNTDGGGRTKVVDFPVNVLFSVSPGGRWVVASVPRKDSSGVADTAIPLDGSAPHLLCTDLCVPVWSPNGKYLFVRVENLSRNGPGQSLAIPLGPDEALPQLPAGGIEAGAGPGVAAGAQLVKRAEMIPGLDPQHYAWVNSTVHRNLYRVSLP